jgi:hypothetical protein
MRQGPKDAVEVLFPAVNHKVDYQHRSPTVNQLVDLDRRSDFHVLHRP